MYSVTTKKLLSLLTAFAMVFGMIAMVQPMQADAATVDVAITNGDFESGSFDGAVSGNSGATIVSNENVHSGNYSVHLTKDGTNPNGTMTITVYPEATDADRTLTMTFWMMIPYGSSANSVHTQFLAWTSGWSLLNEQYGAQYVAADGAWYEKTVSVPVPANTGIVQVQLYAADTGTTPYIDDISMVLDSTDLMTNGGLENGALNGGISTSGGSIELIHQPVHSGNYAAHAKQADGGNITTTVYFQASAQDRSMTLKYWLYVAPNAAANSAHNAIYCFETASGSWNLLSENYGAQYAIPGVWTEMTLPITVAANTDTLQIQLYGADPGADFYIDDLVLTEEITAANVNATLALNAVHGDGTWQFGVTADGEITGAYYKIPATIDGTQCNIIANYDGGTFIVYPNFFPALGGVTPTQQIIIAKDAVLKQIDPNNNWAELNATVTIAETLDKSFDGTNWVDTQYTTGAELALNAVHGDGTWQFGVTADGEITGAYYKIPATIDGTQCNIIANYAGGTLIVYPNFFPELGGVTPTQQIIIAQGAVLKQIDPDNNWTELSHTITITKTLDKSFDGTNWVDTQYTESIIDTELGLHGVVDGTWQLYDISDEQVPEGYYKIPAWIDGTQTNVVAHYTGGMFVIYPDFFGALGGSVPTVDFVIETGAILKRVDPNNGWAEMGGTSLQIVADTVIENMADGWHDMYEYMGVYFHNIPASNVSVFRTEAQADMGRFVIGLNLGIDVDNDANWGNFKTVASKVLVDGNVVAGDPYVAYGMAPQSGDGWSNDNAVLMYILGTGAADMAVNAGNIVIKAGTVLISGTNANIGYRFTEDITLYANCDDSWDTTAEIHNFAENAVDNAKISDATCQTGATYYKSCACGELSTETFTASELGDHNYVDGVCSYCGGAVAVVDTTLSFNHILDDGTWQLSSTAALTGNYYKIPVIIDGVACNILAHNDGGKLLIYSNFFDAIGGITPASKLTIQAGAQLKAVDSGNNWEEIANAAIIQVTGELSVEKVAGAWYNMAPYAGITWTEIHANDLDVWYQDLINLNDYSDAEINGWLSSNPSYKPVYEAYGKDLNISTFGIKSINPELVIPNDADWTPITLLGKILVNGAEPNETYMMQTPDSSDDSETAMTNALLIRFYNGMVTENAASITVQAGTKFIAGGQGFVFVEEYVMNNNGGTWDDIDNIPEPVKPVETWNITLGDQIGVNFVLNLNEGDEVNVTVNGNAVDVAIVDNKFSVKLAAAQMADEIVISINGETVGTYSVRGYADVILADTEGKYTEEAKALVKAMLVYGGAAQTYFGHNTSNLASTDIIVETAEPTGNDTISVSDNLSDIAFYGASLVHKDKTAVRFYFSGSVEGLTFYVGGEKCELAVKDGMYYIEVADINPQDIGDTINVTVTNGTETLTVGYSPLTYIVRMYNKADSTDANKALVKALYGYYLAAEAYVG